MFVQISDENLHHVTRNLMDEIFGAENFILQLITFCENDRRLRPLALATVCDYIVWFAKDSPQKVKYPPSLYSQKEVGGGVQAVHTHGFGKNDERLLMFGQTAEKATKGDHALGTKGPSRNIFWIDNITSQRPAQPAEPFQFHLTR